MTTTSIQDQVDALVSSSVAQDRTQGRQSVDLETAAVVENFATTLLLNPRVVLFFANLARNALVNLVANEIAAAETLVQDIDSLNNVTYDITDTSSLSQARDALLALENHNSVNAAFTQYAAAISTFLSSTIAKNVIGPGPSMKVPAAEAKQDLPTDFAALEAAHAETLSKLSALVVGVQNFQGLPLGYLLSGMISQRAGRDLDDIIASVSSDPSGSQSRDVVTRLITARATLKAITKPPSISDPVLSTVLKLPVGYELTGATEILAPQANTGPVPAAGVVLPTGGSLQVTVDGTTESSGPELVGGAKTLVGGVVAWPVTVPANTHLFLTIDTGTVRIPLNPSSLPLSMTQADVLGRLNSNPAFNAVPFVGTSRLQISTVSSATLVISASCTETMSTTPPSAVSFTSSAHALLGFVLDQAGTIGVKAQTLAAFLNIAFGTMLMAQVQTDGTILVTSLAPKIGSSMRFGGTWAPILGLVGPYVASDDGVVLAGTTPDGSTPDPKLLVQVGDVLSSPTGTSTIVGVSATDITLASELPTFSGPITVTSVLYQCWQILSSNINAFLAAQAGNPLSVDLKTLDAAVSALSGSATLAQCAKAQQILENLLAWLGDLLMTLTDPDSTIPPTGALQEKAIAENLLDALTAKNFDRAADLVSSCQIREFFNLDSQTMSYGGSLLKATSDLARTDLQFPNTSKDEGLVVGSSAGRMSSP